MATTKPTNDADTEDIDAKVDLIVAMVTSLGKLTNVEMRLRFSGDTDGADQIQEKHDELRDAIDRLRGRVADQWAHETEAIREGIRKANAKVQASIRNIQRRINIAQNVTKVIDQIDDALAAVKGLVA